MIIEVTKEEIENLLLRTINNVGNLDGSKNVIDNIRIDITSTEEEKTLRVIAEKGNKSFAIHSFTVVKGDIWKRFILWSMADGFSFLNEYILKQIA